MRSRTVLGSAGLAAGLFIAGLMPAAAIVGAARDAPDRAQSVVMILKREGSRAGFCSGVVIAPRAVLTAAHCVADASGTRIHIRDGSGAPLLFDVARVSRHADYRADAIASRTRSVDLAIVFARDELPRQLVPAPIAAADSGIGARFAIAGYGIAHEDDPRTGGVLREVTLALRAPVSKLLLWLAGRGGACTGDSGGPVFDAGGAVVGIIAFAEGSGADKCGTLTQAVRVAPFREWIETAAGMRR